MSTRPTDPRRVHHPPAGGLGDAGLLGRRPRAVVVGGGIAGLAAATGLAERGVGVEVLEREPYLGGRVGGWRDRLPDGTPVSMGRGFHAFFRQYYNLRNLLRRGDPGLDRLVPLEDYPLVDAEGRVDSFRSLPRTPPWNAVLFALRSPTFRPSDLLRLDPRAAAPLANVSVPGIYEALDHVDAASFVESVNFPPAARHLAFEVFSRSFFAPPSAMSAAELATMFHLYFLGSSEGLVFDVPDDGFDVALWEPLRHYLTTRGVTFRTGVTVSSVTRDPSGDVDSGWFHVDHSDGGTSGVDAVVLAPDVAGLREIIAASPGLGDAGWRDDVAALGSAPPFLVQRLWLDRPVREDRPPFLGTGGLDPLDNISVLDRYEQDAASWAARHGGSVVELHAYSAVLPPDEVRSRCLARLHEIYPETAGARAVGELVEWRADCPMFGVGDFARRPTVASPVDGLVLAGDGIRIDLPVALMERAAATGWQAANRLLAGWGLAGHPLETVPTGGRLGPLTRAAAHVMRQR